jgi:hypothetical protein
MEEVARTLTDLGLPDDMARATVHWQRRIGGAGVQAPEDARTAGPKAMSDLLLPRILEQRRGAA